jgi:murein DD-endopeptidase MepM/ murein hydrolase activator NlpD
VSGLAHRPVHLHVYSLLAASLLVFTATLGWGRAERQRDHASELGIGGSSAEPIAVATPVERRATKAVSRSGSRRSAVPSVQLGQSFVWPVIAPVSSSFGIRDGRPHRGIDLAANHGDSIRAAMGGKVVVAGVLKGYGQTVILEHPGGIRTLYGHCSLLHVTPGQQVKQGQLIAKVGSTGISTGPHLHFEIMMNDRHYDPLLYLPDRKLR